LEHRGPDHRQWLRLDFSWACVWLGHTRLSIQDPSPASHQPYGQEDYVLLYNGEIYNFRESQPTVNSDTQAIFQELKNAGIGPGVHRWQGMFACIWVDRKKERIQCIRDFQGIKPLYVHQHDRIIHLSSELKSLKALGWNELALTPELIQHYLTYKYFPAGSTPFKNTTSCKPGILYQFDQSGASEKTIPHTPEIIKSGRTLQEDVEGLLKESVQKHLLGDVPVGIFLSGGIDSSLLALLASQGGHRLPSYTIAFRAKGDRHRSKDAYWAEKVADQCKFPFRCLSLMEDDLWNSTDWLRSMDIPVGDSAAWLTYELSRLAAREVKAVWSGAGADELFGGYNRHRAYHFYSSYASKKMIWKSGKWISSFLPDSERGRLYKKLFRNVSENPITTWNDFCSMRIPLKGTSLPPRKVTNLREALWDDEKNYLVQDILYLTDQMSMAHGLEVRVPFLFPPLVRRMHETNASELMRNKGKGVLKSLIKKYKADYLLRQDKSGFGAPINAWMKSEMGMSWIKTLNEQHWLSQYLDIPRWNQMKRQYAAGQINLGQELFALYVLDQKSKEW
jgi:asparagine synthase (glutamine-hydrolysing)